jgi:hypothetical protein
MIFLQEQPKLPQGKKTAAMPNCKYRYNFRTSTVFVSILFFLVIQFGPVNTNAQRDAEKGLPFITNYSAKVYDALPQTWCVNQDDRGIMYFGIQNFLLEYDGIKWRKIKLPNTAGTVVRSLAKDKKGLMYFGALGDLGYLGKDSVGQTITKSLLPLIPKENRAFQDIWSTYCTDDATYFQAREFIYRIGNEKKDGSRAVKVWSPTTRFMYAFYLDGTYYVHQQGLGLYKMVNDSLQMVPGSEVLGKERMQIMLPYPDGPNKEKQYLVGLFYSGLYIYDGKTFRPFQTAADGILKSGANLYKGLRLNDQHYALATAGKGIVIIDKNGKLVQRINREVGLQDESVYGTFQDKKGTLWVALDNGISRVDISSPLTRFGLQSGISTGVLSITRFNGDLMVGTTNGVLKYNRTTSLFGHVEGIALNQIFTLLVDSNQLLIPGDGLYAIRNNKSVLVKASVSGDLSINGLARLSHHPNYFFASGTSGVSVFEKEFKPGGQIQMHFLGYLPGLTEQIWSFGENKDGTFWLGTQNQKLFRVYPSFDEKGKIELSKTRIKGFGSKDGLVNAIGQVTPVFGKNYFPSDTSIYIFDEKTQNLSLILPL